MYEKERARANLSKENTHGVCAYHKEAGEHHQQQIISFPLHPAREILIFSLEKASIFEQMFIIVPLCLLFNEPNAAALQLCATGRERI